MQINISFILNSALLAISGRPPWNWTISIAKTTSIWAHASKLFLIYIFHTLRKGLYFKFLCHRWPMREKLKNWCQAKTAMLNRIRIIQYLINIMLFLKNLIFSHKARSILNVHSKSITSPTSSLSYNIVTCQFWKRSDHF